MGASLPALVADLVERFERDRKVFLSGDYREEQLRKAKMPYQRKSIQCQIATTDKAIDALVSVAEVQ